MAIRQNCYQTLLRSVFVNIRSFAAGVPFVHSFTSTSNSGNTNGFLETLRLPPPPRPLSTILSQVIPLVISRFWFYLNCFSDSRNHPRFLHDIRQQIAFQIHCRHFFYQIILLSHHCFFPRSSCPSLCTVLFLCLFSFVSNLSHRISF